MSPIPYFIVGYSGATSLMDKFLSNINLFSQRWQNQKVGKFCTFLEDYDTELRKQYLKE